MGEKNFSCSRMYVGSGLGKFYVYAGVGNYYLHTTGKVEATAQPNGWFTTQKAAIETLERFKKEMCEKSKAVELIQQLRGNAQSALQGQVGKEHTQPVHLMTDHEITAPVLQYITARVVSDGSGGRVVLQIQTPESPEFRPVARLAVKNGRVVMYREQGLKSQFINTDSKGRIQN